MKKQGIKKGLKCRIFCRARPAEGTGGDNAGGVNHLEIKKPPLAEGGGKFGMENIKQFRTFEVVFYMEI
jgi:hypothetical protein